MKQHLITLTARHVLAVVLGIVLALGLLLSGEKGQSWAAPGQSPAQQTIPTRPPTSEATPTLPPSAPTATTVPPAASPPSSDSPPSSPDTGDSNTPGAKATSVPVATSGPATSPGDNETLPVNRPPDASKPTPNGALPVSPLQTPPPDSGVPINQDQADLSLTQTASLTTPVVGAIVTFTLVISNEGPDNATNVAVQSLLPGGLEVSSAIANQGNFSDATERWTIAGIVPGQAITMALVTVVQAAGVMTHTAEVVAVDQFDPDSTPDNGRAEEDDQASVTITASGQQEPKVEETGTPVSAAPNAPSALEPIALEEWGSAGLYWLYALGLGLILILLGIFLVNRA